MISRLNRLAMAAVLVSVAQVASPTTGRADDGAALAQQKCGSCHALKKPGQDHSVADRMNLKGSDLFYAGRKYRKGWMAKWLQNPTRIWPGGMFFAKHVKVTDEGDVIDTNTLNDHVRLPEAEAEKVSSYVMSLHDGVPATDAVAYKPAGMSQQMGKLNFHKFKGCGACHQDSAEFGGQSGPQLYTAFERLTPEYFVSYVRDPVAWSSASLMPKPGLNDAEIYKILNYLKLISENGK